MKFEMKGLQRGMFNLLAMDIAGAEPEVSGGGSKVFWIKFAADGQSFPAA